MMTTVCFALACACVAFELGSPSCGSYHFVTRHHQQNHQVALRKRSLGQQNEEVYREALHVYATAGGTADPQVPQCLL